MESEDNPIKIPGIVNFRKCTLDDRELCRRATDALNQMYNDGKIPARHIPAQPNEDFDLLVGELVVRMLEQREILNAAENYINLSPCDPDITEEQLIAYNKWRSLKNK